VSKKTSPLARRAAILIAVLTVTHGEGDGVPRAAAELDRRDGAAVNPFGESDEVRVRTERSGDGAAIEVSVTLVVPVDAGVVVAVVTDYEHMPRFVPDILATRVRHADADNQHVEIDGVARLAFLVFPIHTSVHVVTHADGTIEIDSLAGDLTIHGTVHVQQQAAHTRIEYRAVVEPTFWVPPPIRDLLIAGMIRRQFEAMVAEMRRRAALPAD
jgi:hypothetical protein